MTELQPLVTPEVRAMASKLQIAYQTACQRNAPDLLEDASRELFPGNTREQSGIAIAATGLFLGEAQLRPHATWGAQLLTRGLIEATNHNLSPYPLIQTGLSFIAGSAFWLPELAMTLAVHNMAWAGGKRLGDLQDEFGNLACREFSVLDQDTFIFFGKTETDSKFVKTGLPPIGLNSPIFHERPELYALHQRAVTAFNRREKQPPFIQLLKRPQGIFTPR